MAVRKSKTSYNRFNYTVSDIYKGKSIDEGDYYYHKLLDCGTEN